MSKRRVFTEFVETVDKKCGQCKQIKLTEEFSKSKHSPDGKQNRCRACQNIRLRKRNTGVDHETFLKLKETHNNTCAICLVHEKDFDSSWLKLCVDHNHDTGQIRGLLCTRCNRSLAGFRDDAEVIDRAAEYKRFYDAVPKESIEYVNK